MKIMYVLFSKWIIFGAAVNRQTSDGTAVNYFQLRIKMDVKFVDFSLKCILTSKMWNKSKKIRTSSPLTKGKEMWQ